MKKYYSFILPAVFMAAAMCMNAQEIAEPDSAVLVQDSLIEEVLPDMPVEDVIPDPEWYVAPIIPDLSAAAPRRAKAAADCPTDSVLTCNVDSVLVEGTYYEFADTIRTTVWTYNPDRSRVGKSKEEHLYDASNVEIYSATYVWDDKTNNWAGETRNEYAYNDKHKMTSSMSYAWVDNAWTPDVAYNYFYDEAGNEIEYISFARKNGIFQYDKRRVRAYNAKGKMILEEQYNSYENGAWVGSTKYVYDFNDAGNQILKEYYSSYKDGAWVGSTKEEWVYTSGKKTYYEKWTWSGGWVNSVKEKWEFNGPSSKQTYYEKMTWSAGAWVGNSKELWEFNGPSNKQTLHEKYGWSAGDWSLTLKEISGYDAKGNNDVVEKHEFKSNKWNRTKIGYVYSGTTKIETINYTWNAATETFVYYSRSVYNNLTNPTDNCSYTWAGDAWVGTGSRTLISKSGGKEIEKLIQTWSSTAKNWVNYTTDSTFWSGANKIKIASYLWQENKWVGTSRQDWHYNAAGLNDTIKTYTNNGVDWLYSNRTVNTYDAKKNKILVHNAKWETDKWIMTSMEKLDVLYDKAGRQTLNATYTCSSDSIWIGGQKDSTNYSATGKPLFNAQYKSWANNDWVPSYKVEYEYDKADHVLVQQQFDWVSNAWKGFYRYEYNYDAAGRQTAYASYNGWSTTYNNWIGSNKTGTVYDSEGNVTESLGYTWKNNEWVASQRYIYTYDSKKRTILYVLQVFTGETWVNSEKNERDYYKDDVLSKNNTYSWIDDKWVFRYRNETYYDNDAQAKLRREIKGTWSSGVVVSFADNHYFYDCDYEKYEIRFEDEDGTLLEKYEVKEGKKPEYKGATPTKAATAEYTYTFKGWTPEIAVVKDKATYTATYSETKNSYQITWLNDDNSLIDKTTVEYGVVPTHDDASKAATAEFTYTFTGWDNAPVAVTGEATYKATFSATKNSYEITWLNDDNTLIDKTNVEYGVVPTHDDATKEATAEFSYTFTGWDKTPVEVTGEATYKATFSSTTRSYTITWQNDDETLIDKTTVQYGLVPTHEDPTKAATAEYTYKFEGWTPSIALVTGDAIYKATFSAKKNKYTVIFKNEDGSILQNTEVEYGETPAAPTDPTKASTDEFSYTFAGWTPEIVPVAGETTYTATYTSATRSYEITWLNDDEALIEKTTVAYGVVPTHEDATKDATAEYTYTFTGWDNAPVAVTGDATYKATFSATKNSYEIAWLNEDESLIEKTNVEYGETPAHDAPTKAATAEYTYTFTGWSPEIVAVTGEATYKATFSETKNKYLITFLDADGSKIQSDEVEYGEMPIAPVDPTKEADEEYTYSFAGWTPEIVAVTEEATYTATYSATPKIITSLPSAATDAQATKVLINGTVYILRAGKLYTLDGREVVE
jgi:hypothetical protein